MPSSVLKVCCEIRHAGPHHLQPPSKPLFSPRALFCHSVCPPQRGTSGGGCESSYILTSVKALFVVKKKYNGTGGRGDSSYILQSATALFLLMQYYIGTGGGGV